jgi:hypothetical protein
VWGRIEGVIATICVAGRTAHCLTVVCALGRRIALAWTTKFMRIGNHFDRLCAVHDGSPGRIWLGLRGG